MAWFRKKKSIKRSSERTFVEDERPAVGASATLSNMGPPYARPPETLEPDHFSGTSSGSGLRGKPERGSREDPGF